MNIPPGLHQERLQARIKAIRDLHEIASHIGVFPLDCMMIDAKLHEESVQQIEFMWQEIRELEKMAITAEESLKGHIQILENRVVAMGVDLMKEYPELYS